jgi:amino acid adenylation domain-containing protein
LEYSRYNVSPATLKYLLETSLAENMAATAIVYNNTKLTYKELHERSNKLAHALITKGIKADDLVAVCLDAGINQITSLLAVIKSGAAYVPIDPDLPGDRIDYMLDDCKAKIIITASHNRKKSHRKIQADVIELDTESNIIELFSSTTPVRVLSPENLAYIIYTSGTTGRPNGVMITHKSVVNNLNWSKKYFNIDSGVKILQKTTFCFDVSVWEIFWPLLCGASLVVINKDDYRDVKKLKNAIESEAIAIVHFVPTMLELFLTDITLGDCSCIKVVVCSGEALTPYQANLVLEKLPGAALHNLYGPTETTVHSTYWQAPDDKGPITRVLIGKPIDDTEILILNEKRELQQKDNIGEIYIGGAGVAKGYFNKPELTAERFIINPFTGDTNKRLFKTGDFGRYLQDGNIEYLGRIDDQVKINGYRIELESVENNIKNSSVVKHAVVLSRKNPKGFMQIVAYVKLLPGSNMQDLWSYLAAKLPGYMLPTSIHEVETIPFTHNGKVDRDELLKTHYTDIVNKLTAPRTESEKVVHTIWKDLFNSHKISIYDNFFDLGGTSLMALTLLSLIKKNTNVHLSFLLLNQYPTIESLAKLLTTPNLVDIPNILVPIKTGKNKPPVYLVNAGGLVTGGFFNLSDELDNDQPVFGFQTNGYNKQGQLHKSIEEVAEDYVNIMIRENASGPYCLAGYSLGGIIAYEMAQQLKALGKEVKLLAMIDSLTRDPELIKTSYNLTTVLRMVGLNLFLLTQNPVRAVNYTIGILKAAFKRIFSTNNTTTSPTDVVSPDIVYDESFNVFSHQIAAYKNYVIKPYNGNIVVFRARKITFYMDDFINLGWKQYAKKVKSISISGHHYSIFDNSKIKTFGKKLQDVLDEGF